MADRGGQYRVSFQGDGNVLGLDSDGSGITIDILKQLSYIL